LLLFSFSSIGSPQKKKRNQTTIRWLPDWKTSYSNSESDKNNRGTKTLGIFLLVRVFSIETLSMDGGVRPLDLHDGERMREMDIT
jgi:hypothetical protein